MTSEEVLNAIKLFGPIKRKRLAQRLSISERKLQMFIEALRNAGEPITNEGAGYEYTTDPEKLSRTAKIFRSQGWNMITTAKRLEGTTHREQLRRMSEEHQTNLFAT